MDGGGGGGVVSMRDFVVVCRCRCIVVVDVVVEWQSESVMLCCVVLCCVVRCSSCGGVFVWLLLECWSGLRLLQEKVILTCTASRSG